jgi:ribosomal protein L11 methyltransferase
MPDGTGADRTARKGAPPQELRRAVLGLVGGRRLCPADVLKALAGSSAPLRKRVQSAIRALVAEGELAYTAELGRTFLEPSFDRAVRVSRRLVLCPPGRRYDPRPDEVLIRIAAGASFGAGRHPTTRLALRGIEFALETLRPAPGPDGGGGVLDVGTGTGVLAMAAVKLGMSRGVGIDLDPCAVSEARENVRLNGLGDQVEISDRPLETIVEAFALAAANLRPPSLVELSAAISARVEPRGVLVVSGFRIDELAQVLSAYRNGDFTCAWEAAEDDWAGMVLKRSR